MRKITLTNDFHHTAINLIPREGKLSPRQVRRAERALCGMSDCTCGDAAGMRGRGGANSAVLLCLNADNEVYATITED